MSEGLAWVVCQGDLCQHDSASQESKAKQNCDMLRGLNYGVMQVQCAALSTADPMHVMGHAGAIEREIQGGLLNR